MLQKNVHFTALAMLLDQNLDCGARGIVYRYTEGNLKTERSTSQSPKPRYQSIPAMFNKRVPLLTCKTCRYHVRIAGVIVDTLDKLLYRSAGLPHLPTPTEGAADGWRL